MMTMPAAPTRPHPRARSRPGHLDGGGLPQAPREPDASPAVLEFAMAMQRYRQESGRMFPTWSEVLEVLRGLGYEKGGGADPR
jgi:hypothetical protein